MKQIAAIALTVAVLVMGPCLFLCWYFTGVSLRYSVNLEVDVDGVPHVGTTVVEATVGRGFDTAYSYAVSAEALAVDLGDRGYLFAVKRDSNGGYGHESLINPFGYFGQALPELEDKQDGLEIFRRANAELPLGKAIEIPLRNLPMLVRFRDISDHLSIEYVSKDFPEESLGPGVKIARFWIERTNAAIERHIDGILPWLNAKTSFMHSSWLMKMHGGIPIDSIPPEERLNNTDFVRRN